MTDCYRRPPVVLAQTLLSLDHLSKGRVALMLGTGENKQFVPYGLERALPRYKRLEESIRNIKALMRSNDPITLDGEFWPIRDALLALEPYNPGMPPLVYLLGGGPTAMKIAGRVADGLGTYTPGGYDDDVAGFEEDFATLRAEAERHDRDPNTIPVFPANTMILCEEDAQVDATLASTFSTSVRVEPDADRRALGELGIEAPARRRLGAVGHAPVDELHARRDEGHLPRR